MKEKILLIFVGIVLSVTTQTIAETLISSDSVSYSNNKTKETTVNGALDELFSTVDINERLGNTDISSIGNGTVTNAISTLNTNLSGKQATITGGASTIASSNLTSNRALISDGNGKVTISAVTSTELGYLDGVTSNIQSQLNVFKAMYVNYLGTTQTIANNGQFCAITVPPGTYVIGGYVMSDSSANIWLNGVTNMNDPVYAKVVGGSGFMKIITVTATTRFYYANLNGAAYTYYGSTGLVAHRLT